MPIPTISLAARRGAVADEITVPVDDVEGVALGLVALLPLQAVAHLAPRLTELIADYFNVGDAISEFRTGRRPDGKPSTRWPGVDWQGVQGSSAGAPCRRGRSWGIRGR
jgi:hypothetical protein